MYLLDVWRRQSAPDAWIDALCDLVETWKPIGWAEESGQIASGIGPFLEKRMRQRRTRVYRQPFAARLDIGERSDAVLRTAMARRLPRRAAGVSDRPP
jgi:hypothetical protein